MHRKYPNLDPYKTAKQLISVNFSSADYENGVQSDRLRQLKTFKETGVQELINLGEDLVEFGNQVLKILKEHEASITKN